MTRELYLANEKLKEITDDKFKNFDHNIKLTNKNNGNAFDSDTQDFKSTHSGGNNAIKFPNKKIAGYANIKNIDESELNESDYRNSNNKLSEYKKINIGMTDHKRENELYVESGGFRNKIGDNKHDDLLKNTNRIGSVDKDKSKANNMITSGNNFNKINSNNTSNYNVNSKNNFNDSQAETLLNFENRSNSHVIFCFSFKIINNFLISIKIIFFENYFRANITEIYILIIRITILTLKTKEKLR